MAYYCFRCQEKVSTPKCPKCNSLAREVTNLSKFMLRDERHYIIDKVKAPLLKAIITLANRLKIEPTKQNCHHPNSHVLIDIWDKFFEMEDNPGRDSLFKALLNISVSEHESDPYYRDRMQIFLELWLEEVLKGNWIPRNPNDPPSCWKNDYRGIGYEFIKSHYKEKTNGK